MQDNTEYLNELLALSEEELYARLGDDGGQRAAPENFSGRGKEVFISLKGRLQMPICSNVAVKAVFDDPESSRLMLLTCLMDSLAGMMSAPALATFCALLVKEGVVTLCRDVWSQQRM